MFAEDEARLLLSEARSAERLAAWVDQRVDGRPLEQILGWAEFAGLRMAVEPGVFVPRRRTEWLAEQVARLVRDGARLAVDLCCGVGAVGAAGRRTADEPGRVHWHAVDIDPAAVRCARRNLPADAQVLRRRPVRAAAGLGARPGRPSSPQTRPTCRPSEIALMPPEARLHEPAVALDGGDDGLAVQRRIVAEAPQWLAPGGSLLIETSRAQAAGTAAAFLAAGLRPRITTCDALDATVVVGSLP